MRGEFIESKLTLSSCSNVRQQVCHNYGEFALTDFNSVEQLCGVYYRESVVICEAAICSDADYQSETGKHLQKCALDCVISRD